MFLLKEIIKMSINSLRGYTITQSQFREDSIPNKEKEPNKGKREKKVKIIVDALNKSGKGINKSIKKTNVKIKGTFIKKGNLLNLENQEKINKLNGSFLSIDNNLDFSRSSSNAKYISQNKNHISGNNLPTQIVFTEGSLHKNNTLLEYQNKQLFTLVNQLRDNISDITLSLNIGSTSFLSFV